MRPPPAIRVARRAILVGGAATAAAGLTAAAPMPLRARRWFVDARDGDDRADGLAPATAWHTLARAGRAVLAPGDQLLLASGHPHRGPLRLTASGTAHHPVLVGTYGRDRAVIEARDGDGLVWLTAGGIVVRDLDIRGAGPSNRGCGLRIENRRGGGDRGAFVRIERVRAAGFSTGGGDPTDASQGCGVFVGGAASAKCGFRDVAITDCEVTDNGLCGILVDGAGGGPTDYANADVRITGCRAWNNPGLPHYTLNWSGSGILLGNTEGGMIANCAAWENGRLNPPGAPGGPIGIWSYASRGIVIEHCHAFHNTSGGLDGGGFDFDGGVQDSVMRHNHAHDNKGAGYLVYNYRGAPTPSRRIRIEDNFSIRDGGNDRFAGLMIQTHGPPIEDVVFARNVVIAAAHQVGVRIDARGPLARVRFEGNLVEAAGGRGWAIEGSHAGIAFNPALSPGEGAPLPATSG